MSNIRNKPNQTFYQPGGGGGGGGAVTSVNGQTGDVTLTKGSLGLSNVDNTSDASKPVSTAQAAAIAAAQAASQPVAHWSTLTGTSPALAFSSTPQAALLALSGNTTFTASGYGQGFTFDIFITGDTIIDTLAFPTGWIWTEGTPASLAAGKHMHIQLTCTGSTAGSVYAVYAVEQ